MGFLPCLDGTGGVLSEPTALQSLNFVHRDCLADAWPQHPFVPVRNHKHFTKSRNPPMEPLGESCFILIPGGAFSQLHVVLSVSPAALVCCCRLCGAHFKCSRLLPPSLPQGGNAAHGH